MKLFDAFDMGVYNLRRAILRTVLTTLGVVVGIGTLSSMISFGVGMETNIVDSFKKNDLFTTLYITEQKINIDDAMDGDFEAALKDTTKNATPLNDSVLSIIQKIPEVEVAFPEISIPVKLNFRNSNAQLNIIALPSKMGEFPPYNNITYGKFFESDNSDGIVLSDRALKRMKIVIKDEKHTKLSEEEKKRGFVLLPIDSVLGQEISVYTADFNSNLISIAVSSFLKGEKDSIKDRISENAFTGTETKFKIIGINISENNFGNEPMRGGAIISSKKASELPRLNFNSAFDILKKSDNRNGSVYESFYVRVKTPNDINAVKTKFKEMNLNVMSFLDQLDEVRQVFFVMDSILAAIGIISLFVAALGIINTMVMSILERKKEIGIMKSIGASESDIRKIYFVESSIIGIMGGAFGLLLGWVVTEIASLIIDSYFTQQGIPKTELFSFPLWLIAGAILFSVTISLIAGLYPAYRAAKVDPVVALRHE